MNTSTWTECIILAIKELVDNGITSIIKEKTVRMIHTHFHLKEHVTVPNRRNQGKPKLFPFSSDATTKIVKYCHAHIKGGYSSTELLLSEVKKVIIHRCYNSLLLEAVENNRRNMSAYNKLLHMLDLKTISMSTMWRWLDCLGFKYDENT